MLLAKYATSVAAGTALFHLHACFKWSAAIGNEGMLGDAGWWQGKAMLAALSLALQKLPTILLGRLFHTDKLRRSRLALNRKPPKACGLFCRVGRPFAVVPWAMFVLLVVACFGITIVLTSTGFLQGKTNSPGEDTAPQCGCGSTVSGEDVEGDWISLLLMVVVFRTFVYVLYMMSYVMSDRGRLEPCRSVYVRVIATCTCHSDDQAIRMQRL